MTRSVFIALGFSVLSLSVVAACRSKQDPGSLEDSSEKAADPTPPPGAAPDGESTPDIPFSVPGRYALMIPGERGVCAWTDDGLRCLGEYPEGFTRLSFLVPPAQLFQAGTVQSLNERGITKHLDDGTEIPLTIADRPYAVSAAGWRACALDAHGTICWGGGIRALPKLMRPGSIAAAYSNTCVVTDGRLTCWSDSRWAPMDPPPLEGVRQVALGQAFGCAVLRDRTLHCWGKMSVNEQLEDPRELAAGEGFACAIDGTRVKCWGGAEAPPTFSPSDLTMAGETACVVDQGKVVCWKKDGSPLVTTFGSIESLKLTGKRVCVIEAEGWRCRRRYEDWTDMSHLGKATKIWNGPTESFCISLASGKIQCYTDGESPHYLAEFDEIREVTAVAVQHLWACILRPEGDRRVQCKDGLREGGEIPDPPTLRNPREIAVSNGTACVLDDGGVTCWGRDAGVVTRRSDAFEGLPSGLIMYQSSACVIDTGKVVCWGSGGPPDLSRPVRNPRRIHWDFQSFCVLDDVGLVCSGVRRIDLPGPFHDVDFAGGTVCAIGPDGSRFDCSTDRERWTFLAQGALHPAERGAFPPEPGYEPRDPVDGPYENPQWDLNRRGAKATIRCVARECPESMSGVSGCDYGATPGQPERYLPGVTLELFVALDDAIEARIVHEGTASEASLRPTTCGGFGSKRFAFNGGTLSVAPALLDSTSATPREAFSAHYMGCYDRDGNGVRYMCTSEVATPTP